MKLIRISSTDEKGVFETQFNQSIIVNPHSKIALSSLTSNLKPIIYVSDGDFIDFIITFGNSYYNATILLISGTYTKANYQTLLDEITTKLNAKMVYDNIVGRDQLIGGEWRIYIKNKIIQLSYLIGFEAEFTARNTNFSTSVENNDSGTSPPEELLGLYDASVVSTTAYTNCAASNIRMAMGMSRFQTKIWKQVEDTSQGIGNGLNEQGFLMVLTENEMHPANMAVTDIKYGFGVGYDGTGFKFYRQEGATITNLAVAPIYISEGSPLNSRLEILVNGNKVDFRYSNGSGAWVTIYTHNHDSAVTLYPAIIFHSNTDYTIIINPEANYDPYLSPRPPKPSSIPLEILVTFGDIDSKMSSFFNYDEGLLVSPKKIGGYEFIADRIFVPSIIERNLILELISHNIESYDSAQKQRRNILSNLITSNKDDVITNENVFIFIDLNNKNTLDMRNITMRLVDEYYRPVDTLGNSVATILIADENEKL